MASPSILSINHLFLFAVPLVATAQLLPGTITPFKSLGCYTDTNDARTLAALSFNNAIMTPEVCIAQCSSRGYAFAGVEFANQCYCDHALQNPGKAVAASECNFACVGNRLQICGGRNRISVYRNDLVPAPRLIQAPSTGVEYLGCYTDTSSARTLTSQIPVAGGVTPASCAAACRARGDKYSGVQYMFECHCGNTVNPASARQSDGDCRMACKADPTLFCGGKFRLQLYEDSSSECKSATYPQPFKMFAVTGDQPISSSSPAVGVSQIFGQLFSGIGILNQASGDWRQFSLNNGALVGENYLSLNPSLSTQSIGVEVNGSPLFQGSLLNPTVFDKYCFATRGDTVLLGVNGETDVWSVCRNLTALGRPDIVYKYTSGSQLLGCRSVNIALQDV
ncbi:hypothetical protein HGRIS_004443 [Hohenbuehelia grisea]|uniref:WSC domain-containing protein n=1 Tax=Hohenbuehelia grisea TaxID=104357 RepID=A0ABR3JC04_9AGAR